MLATVAALRFFRGERARELSELHSSRQLAQARARSRFGSYEISPVSAGWIIRIRVLFCG